jgi:hypothetical protein
MTLMLDRFKQIGAEWKIVAVFHEMLDTCS